jgi:glycosyltransferase involved in cell wall biosynthesis
MDKLIPSGNLLVIGHDSTVRQALEIVAAEAPPDARIDMLSYGRGASAEEIPGRVRPLALPDLSGSPLGQLVAVWGFARHLWAGRYAAVVIAQPALRRSRMRALFYAFPFLIGSRRSLVFDTDRAVVERGPSPMRALADVLAWLALRVFSALLSPPAVALVRRGARGRARVGLPVPTSGRVVYLRTDIALANAALTAGGSLAHSEGIVKALLKQGYAVEVRSTGTMAGLPSSAEQRKLPVVHVANVADEIREFLSGLLQAAVAKRPSDVAFVYQRYSLNNLAGLLLARRWRVPLVLEANASETKWKRQWTILRFEGLSNACELLLLCQADRVVAVSDNASRDLEEAGMPPGRARVVPNGVDVDRFASAKPHKLPFPPDAFVVGFAGLFYPWHGIPVLTDAFLELRRLHPHAKLLLVGDGEQAPRARAALRRGGASGDALFTGLVPPDAVPGYLAAADVLVSPHTDIENFIGSPVKIFEYMATGRAMVASRVAQMGALLVDGETALLVTPDKPDELCAALARLVEDPKLRDDLGRAARRTAEAAHSWDARLASILEADRC